MNIQYLCDFIY